MRSRAIFLTIFLLVLSALYGYLGLRLAVGIWLWLALAIPFFLVLSYLLVIRSRARTKTWVEFALTQLAYVNMGLLSFLLVFTVAGDLLRLFGVWLSAPMILFSAILALSVGVLRGAFGPRVKHVRLKFENLPKELEGYRIAQISDLHMGPTIGERYVNRVVKKTIAENPQLIALTGDIGDARPQDLALEIKSLSGLTQAAPVYLVPGNHEYYWDLEAWMAAFRGAGLRVLLNQGEHLSNLPIYVAGITDPAAAQIGGGAEPDLIAAEQGGETARFKILLSHRPGVAQEASRFFDLQLSGHTHGGQFFPWTLVVRLVHRYALGAYRLGKMWVYVSAGTGSWGPRIRLGTTAEITLIELAAK